MNHHDGRRSPNDFRGGGGGGHQRPFDSPPGQSPGAGGGFRLMGGGVGVFRPIEGGGFDSNYQSLPLAGQKRGYPFSGRGGSPDRLDGSSFAKLFVGSVPRTATEEDIRPLFEEHGTVLEVALIKDKRTGQQQGCCFIKYASSEEADMAIRALHNQHTLPGGVGPVQVRYADGERERLGAVEYKLFVGSLNKQATEKEVEEIFSPYGRVEDVYLMRDELKQSRGCGFVKYSNRDMALGAINSLNGVYTMRGCDQPLTVRFADPKRPRSGDSRGAPAFGGPGFGPRLQAPGTRPLSNFGEPMGERLPSNAWRPPNFGTSADVDNRGFGGQFPPRSGGLVLPFNSSMPQVPPVGQQISPLQKPVRSPQNLPPSLQLNPQTPSSYSQSQTSVASVRPLGQPQYHHTGQTPYSQAATSQQSLGPSGPLIVSQPLVQQGVSSVTASQTPLSINLHPHTVSTLTNQHQQLVQPPQQSPSQLAQMLSQQTQTLQASFQSSQQAFSQLQQQLQLMQPANQGVTMQQNSQVPKQQSQWTGGITPRTVGSTTGTKTVDVPSSTPTAPSVPLNAQAVAPVKCNWTEHTSPDGYKYYYNSVTGESRWDKPEDLTMFERQQQKPSVQQPTNQPLSQTQQLPQSQQVQYQPQQVQYQPQLQTQLHHQQLQQHSLSSSYQASGVASHQNIQAGGYNHQLQAANNRVIERVPQPQGIQASQDWTWKNKPAGA